MNTPQIVYTTPALQNKCTGKQTITPGYRNIITKETAQRTLKTPRRASSFLRSFDISHQRPP